MLIRIVEKDQDYVNGLSTMLKDNHNAIFVDGNTAKVADDFDPNSYHGIQVVDEQNDKDLEEVRQWLENYTGSFEFYISLRNQLKEKGSLSEKQMNCVFKAIDRESAKKPAPKTFTITAGTLIRFGKRWAKNLAEEAGLVKPHFLFEVTNVFNETAKAYQVELKFSAQKTSHCCLCGRHLTDPRSVETGVGPICADNHGISFSDSSIEELAAKLSTVEVIKTWIPKSVIKERIS